MLLNPRLEIPMKSFILAATFATLALSVGAPLQAAGTAINPLLPTLTARHGCDTAHDIKQHPRCTQP